jgi:hypothetical protein
MAVKQAKKPVALNQISVAVHYGCMGLPQELVDHIMDMLHDDLRALKACSLTCKSMFVSTEHLIHQTLYLTQRNNWSVLTGRQRIQLIKGCWYYPALELPLLSYMGERGLLQHTRQVHIRTRLVFAPRTLQPHLHHFQSLDRVHTLTIDYCTSTQWANDHKTFFAHFYPTLTSLTLHRSYGNYRHLLQFALQFPNLENLCLEWMEVDWRLTVGNRRLTVPAITHQSPPLCGHLRLVGFGDAVYWLADLVHELPNGINFRSVTLGDFYWDGSNILNACARTLENLSIVAYAAGMRLLLLLSLDIPELFVDFPTTGYPRLLHLTLAELTVLRRLTFRMAFSQVSNFRWDLLLRVLSTIVSPIFYEFVLELREPPSIFGRALSEHWERWKDIDALLEERFAEHGDFRFVVRTDKLHDRATFQRRVKKSLPFLARRECVHFETCHD